MFILRRITSENNEVNTCLGETYHLVSKEKHKNEFYRTYYAYLGQDPDSKITDDFKNSVENSVYAFIINNEGKNIIPLHNLSNYYIMTSDGKTFSNITFR